MLPSAVLSSARGSVSAESGLDELGAGIGTAATVRARKRVVKTVLASILID